MRGRTPAMTREIYLPVGKVEVEEGEGEEDRVLLFLRDKVQRQQYLLLQDRIELKVQVLHLPSNAKSLWSTRLVTGWSHRESKITYSRTNKQTI